MKRPSELSDSLHQRLDAYALAASAAGVSVLALARPAEGKIVYTPAHLVMSTSDAQHWYPLDLNHDGVKDFSFSAYNEAGMSSQFAFLRCGPWAENNIFGGANSARRQDDDAAFLMGDRIGPSGHYAGHVSMARVGIFPYSSSFQGPWANGGKGVKDRYLGLKFAINGKTHYGWARLNVEVGYNVEVYIKATLTGYAYETIPNKSIIAGKTHGKDVITVQPASLGHLARGASAMKAWRQKESVGATH